MLNKVHLIGNLGKNAEIKSNQAGEKSVASFSVATSETYRDKETNELVTKTEWHRVVCFHKNLFELLEKYAPKGRQVYVEGKLHTHTYRKDGESSDRYSTDIIAEVIGLLGNKKETVQE